MNHIENLCIHHLFEFQVDQKPDAIAILFGEKHLTYRELNQQATLLAYYLQSLGVSQEAQDLCKIKYKDETPEKLLLCTTFIDKKQIIRQVPKLASRLPFRSNNEVDRAFKRKPVSKPEMIDPIYPSEFKTTAIASQPIIQCVPPSSIQH